MRPITFQTKVYELLEDYPQLEDILTEISPAFAKLKNPVLRRTIARVTTIQQAAAIAGIEAGEVVSKLRRAAGIIDSGDEPQANYGADSADDTNSRYTGEQPKWFGDENITIKFDAGERLESGGVPMAEIIKLSNSLKDNEIFEFSSPFLPTPVLDMLSAKGFLIWSKKEGSVYLNRVKKGE